MFATLSLKCVQHVLGKEIVLKFGISWEENILSYVVGPQFISSILQMFRNVLAFHPPLSKGLAIVAMSTVGWSNDFNSSQIINKEQRADKCKSSRSKHLPGKLEICCR